MIYQNYPNPNKPKKALQLPHIARVDYTVAKRLSEQRNITIAEWWRRNGAVERLYKKCAHFTVGNMHFPVNQEARTLYGLCTIKSVFKDYTEVPLAEEWPKDDQPYLITVSSSEQQGLILCTEDWLDPKPVEVMHVC